MAEGILHTHAFDAVKSRCHAWSTAGFDLIGRNKAEVFGDQDGQSRAIGSCKVDGRDCERS